MINRQTAFRLISLAIITSSLLLSLIWTLWQTAGAQATTGQQLTQHRLALVPVTRIITPPLTITLPASAYLPHIRFDETPTPTPAPTATPTATPNPDPAWLVYLNQFRDAAGLHPLSENAGWSEGSWQHGRYMVKNDVITHSQNPSNPWYSLEGHLAGQNGNVFVSGSLNTADASAINYWMTAPFHALPIIHPRLYTVGYGSYRENIGTWKMGATLDVRRGRDILPPGFSYPLMYPSPDGNTWLRSFGGFEWPDPLTHCGYAAPTGAPVMLQIGNGSLTPQVTAHSFQWGETPLPHCVFDETNFSHPDPSQQNSGRQILNNQDAIVLLPQSPLVMGESYTVSLTVNGVVYTWRFSVTAGPAHLQLESDAPYRIGGE
jgi:uncharacterized protein YkwD